MEMRMRDETNAGLGNDNSDSHDKMNKRVRNDRVVNVAVVPGVEVGPVHLHERADTPTKPPHQSTHADVRQR